MRLSRVAVVAAALVTSLSAQSAPAGKQFVRPPQGQNLPYYLAVKTGGVIYVSGQMATDAAGTVIQGDIRAQTKQVFDNLRGVLQQTGASLDNTVHANVFLQNAADLAAMDEVYRQQFKGDPPARTTIIGSLVRPGALIGIALTAVDNAVARKAILPTGWAKPTSPYSYAILAGDTLYMSGLVSRSGRDNAQVQGDIAKQVKTIMDNAGEILKAAGMGYGDLAAGHVVLKDMTLFAPMNDAYRVYWEQDRPARVSCQAAPPGTYDVEITFVAIKGASPREVIVPKRPDGTLMPIGPNYSPAIKVGNRVFVSGGTGVTDANETDMKGQVVEALTRFGPALRAAGFDYKDVVMADVYVKDVARFNEMNEGFRTIFTGADLPARATVGVGRLANEKALAEMMVTAAK